jgi:hypothetical protein
MVKADICNSVVSSEAASPLQNEEILAMQSSANEAMLIECTAGSETDDLP